MSDFLRRSNLPSHLLNPALSWTDHTLEDDLPEYEPPELKFKGSKPPRQSRSNSDGSGWLKKAVATTNGCAERMMPAMGDLTNAAYHLQNAAQLRIAQRSLPSKSALAAITGLDPDVHKKISTRIGKARGYSKANTAMGGLSVASSLASVAASLRYGGGRSPGLYGGTAMNVASLFSMLTPAISSLFSWRAQRHQEKAEEIADTAQSDVAEANRTSASARASQEEGVRTDESTPDVSADRKNGSKSSAHSDGERENVSTAPTSSSEKDRVIDELASQNVALKKNIENLLATLDDRGRATP
jgi:hypothetical protein